MLRSVRHPQALFVQCPFSGFGRQSRAHIKIATTSLRTFRPPKLTHNLGIMSSPYDSDSELQKAIALSLEASKSSPLGEPSRHTSASGNSDSELERAIALSLKPPDISRTENGTVKKPEVIEISDSDDEIDNDQLEGQVPAKRQRQMNTQMNTEPKNASVLALLDRKEMEEERLARLARKRKAPPISPPSLDRRPYKQEQISDFTLPMNFLKPRGLENDVLISAHGKIMDSAELPLAKFSPAIRNAQSISSEGTQESEPVLPQIVSKKTQPDLMKPGIHFPEGVVKKTWVQGYPRDNDIKIEEIFQKNDLEMAVLSAFQWDTDWLLSKLDLSKTKLVCVIQAETDEEKSRMRKSVPSSIRFCFPSMAGQINCMHSKLQLLAHPTYLRVVVPSANLVPYDWGEGQMVMENVVFIIDLPRLLNGQKIDINKSTSFHRELIHFLSAMGMEQSIINSSLNFDFSRTARFAFVHSIGGSNTGSDWHRTGYSGLGVAIQELGIATKGTLDINFVSASIGSLSIGFLKAMYLAAQGDNGMTELNWRTIRPSKSRNSSAQASQAAEEEKVVEEVLEHVRIYFPSQETVANSKGGIRNGGTICFQSRWYDSPTFPKSLMRDCKSQRPGMLMHNKIIFVQLQQPSLGTGGEKFSGWAYVGSANLSESAWGRLVKDKSTKEPKMNCRNWECGVVVPVPAKPTTTAGSLKLHGDDNKGSQSKGSPRSMEIFEGVVPVPMMIPGDEYGEKRPWFFQER